MIIKTNPDKANTVIISKKNVTRNITIRRGQTEEVKQVLGNSNRDQLKQTTHRKGRIPQKQWFWENLEISKEIQKIVTPILIHGSESFLLTKAIRTDVNVIEMDVLRNMEEKSRQKM